MKVYCFFEQSGVFKNEFKKLGFESYDLDILNDFNETDYKLDLFYEIDNAYKGLTGTIFDNISSEDLIFAFFPCVRFTKRMKLNFKRSATGCKVFSVIDKLEQNINYFDETNFYYRIISELCIVCLRNDIKLIIENPYQKDHILTQYFYLEPKIIDMNRHKMGDYYKKPTQYFFINCEPKYNNQFDLITYFDSYKKINDIHNKVERSLISPNYARYFIKEFII